MYGAIAYEAFEESSPYAATQGLGRNGSMSLSKSSVPQCNHFEGQIMETARGNLARTVDRKNTPNSSSEEADVIFISTWARRLSAKEGAAFAGMTPKGFQKVQSGDNAISYKKLTRWLKADTDFAAAYAVHIGLILPGEAESASAFTRAVNAYQRRQG